MYQKRTWLFSSVAFQLLSNHTLTQSPNPKETSWPSPEQSPLLYQVSLTAQAQTMREVNNKKVAARMLMIEIIREIYFELQVFASSNEKNGQYENL